VARTIAKDYDKKRGQILKTAAKVFAESGFDRASMSQLAKACNISKANIYHYYDSKDALLFGVLDTYLRELRDRLIMVNGEGLSPDDHLRELVKEVLLAYHGADNEHRVQAAGISSLPPEQQKTLRGYQRDMVEQMSDVVKDVAPAKYTQNPQRLLETTMSIYGMLNWYYMWNRDPSEEARITYAKTVTELVLNGIKD
jgi:AcrR family transcriptional regulator